MTTPRVLIIGCGYLGTATARRLVDAGFDCVGTTTRAERLDEITATGAGAVVLDLADADALRRRLADRDVVFLMIAPGRRSADYRKVYLDGASQVMAAVLRIRVRKVVYTSSTRVYGQRDGRWVDETTPPAPVDERGRILLETERVILDGAASRGIITTVVRVGGLYGPGREPGGRAIQLAGKAATGGERFVNLVHRDDAAEALTRLVTVDYSGVLNLCGDDPPTRRTLYDRMIEKRGLAAIRWQEQVGDGSDDLGKRVSNALIKRILGVSPARPPV